MHRSIGFILIIQLAFASEFYDQEAVEKLVERVLAMRPQQSNMDSTTLAKSSSLKIHGTRPIKSMMSGRHSSSLSTASLFPRPHAPVSSLFPGSHALQISKIAHARGDHQSDVDASSRRQLISGLAATLVAASTQVTAPALAVLAPTQNAQIDSLDRFKLQQQLAVLDRLLSILAEATQSAETAAAKAAAFIADLNDDKGAGNTERNKAADTEQEIAVTAEFAASIAKTACATAAKIESLAAKEITQLDIKAINEGTTSSGAIDLASIQRSAAEAKIKVDQVQAALESAQSYAAAAARAIPKVGPEVKKGEKKSQGERAAVAVAVVAAGKAQAQIKEAVAALSVATEQVCKAPNYCGVFKGF